MGVVGRFRVSRNHFPFKIGYIGLEILACRPLKLCGGVQWENWANSGPACRASPCSSFQRVQNLHYLWTGQNQPGIAEGPRLPGDALYSEQARAVPVLSSVEPP